MIDKNKVIDILKKYPKGLKAKDISDFIVGADRKAINQVLYSNPTLFFCNSNYEWTLISKATTERKITTSNNIIQENNSYTDREVFCDYKNYYVEVKQGSYNCEDKTRPGAYHYRDINLKQLKINLQGENYYDICQATGNDSKGS